MTKKINMRSDNTIPNNSMFILWQFFFRRKILMYLLKRFEQLWDWKCVSICNDSCQFSMSLWLIGNYVFFSFSGSIVFFLHVHTSYMFSMLLKSAGSRWRKINTLNNRNDRDDGIPWTSNRNLYFDIWKGKIRQLTVWTLCLHIRDRLQFTLFREEAASPLDGSRVRPLSCSN